MKRKLIALMIASSITVAVAAGCTSGKTEEEKANEDKIRQLLEYDANIDIEKNNVVTYGINPHYEVSNTKEFLITFETKKAITRGYVVWDKITYSVDKDFFYNFKNNYSTKETQKEVDLVAELTLTYSPIKVIEGGEEQTL